MILLRCEWCIFSYCMAKGEELITRGHANNSMEDIFMFGRFCKGYFTFSITCILNQQGFTSVRIYVQFSYLIYVASTFMCPSYCSMLIYAYIIMYGLLSNDEIC